MNKYFKRERIKGYWYYIDTPVNAIEIPDHATNGDVIKAIFSDNVFAEERWQDENGKMYTDVISDNGMTFTDIWWNSPYKRGKLK